MLALPGVVYRPLSGVPAPGTVDLSCIYRSDDQSPLLAAFLAVVRQFRAGEFKAGSAGAVDPAGGPRP